LVDYQTRLHVSLTFCCTAASETPLHFAVNDVYFIQFYSPIMIEKKGKMKNKQAVEVIIQLNNKKKSTSFI